MRVNRVHVAQPLAVGAAVELTGPAAHHVGTVLRMRPGDTLHLFDGSGGSYLCRVAAHGARSVTVEALEFIAGERESDLPLTLAQGVSRGAHMDFAVQKAVELGVRRIVPLLTRNGNVKLDPARLEQRMQHWRGIIVGACEQCGRNRLPELLRPVALPDWVDADRNPLKIAMHPLGSRALRDLPGAGSGVTLLSGPEGGLAEEEYAAAQRAGYVAVRLGPRILRTETAALAALAVCQALWGDLH